MSDLKHDIDWPLPPTSTVPAGFAIPMQLHPEAAALSGLAAQVLADPIAFRKLSERVMELLEADLRMQRDRNHPYGGTG